MSTGNVTPIGAFPLLIEFAAGTALFREPRFVPKLPILQNGPPGTYVIFAGGARVPLPTDQIVFAEEAAGRICVGFGGMRFEGLAHGQLVFRRVRDLQPSEHLSPERSRKMTLEPPMVAAISAFGRPVWPHG